MPDTLNLPTLAVFQLPANPRADSAPVAPERLGDPSAAGGTMVSFADLIKAMSAPDADSSLDVNIRPDSPEAPIDPAATIGSPPPPSRLAARCNPRIPWWRGYWLGLPATSRTVPPLRKTTLRRSPAQRILRCRRCLRQTFRRE